MKKLAKFALAVSRHPVYTFNLVKKRATDGPIDSSFHLRAGAEWLLKAQSRSSDGDGYSRTFSLLRGWDKGYVETTGYIIPTMLDVAVAINEPRYRDSAHRAGEWLRRVQNPDGSFSEIDEKRPLAFDTGQVLLGLNRLSRETGDDRFADSGKRAGDWLADRLESDGTWTRVGLNGIPHSYYSRVAAALIELSALTKEERYRECGEKNLEWVVAQQRDNGYFEHCRFRPDEPALLHTIVYVLEGLLMAYHLTGESRWLEPALKGIRNLELASGDDGLPHAQYDSGWNATNKEYCITGLAQWAGVCLDAYELSGEPRHFEVAERTVRYLCSIQARKGDDIAGALPSSEPVWGYYGGMECFNWNVKFFLDAVMRYRSVLGRPAV